MPMPEASRPGKGLESGHSRQRVPMASHQVAIAKASLAAALLRPDPTSVARDDISHFHTLLDRAITECSAANIQVWSFILGRLVGHG